MIDLDEFNQDIDDNYTAHRILKERAPHISMNYKMSFIIYIERMVILNKKIYRSRLLGGGLMNIFFRY